MGITLIMMIDLEDCHDALYAHDGVHLSFFYERNFVINSLPGAIEQFILTPHKRRYPGF